MALFRRAAREFPAMGQPACEEFALAGQMFSPRCRLRTRASRQQASRRPRPRETPARLAVFSRRGRPRIPAWIAAADRPSKETRSILEPKRGHLATGLEATSGTRS